MFNSEEVLVIFKSEKALDFISKNINKENVNIPTELNYGNGLDVRISFLQLALSIGSVVITKKLLEIGADPDQVVPQPLGTRKGMSEKFEKHPFFVLSLSNGDLDKKLEMILELINFGSKKECFDWGVFLSRADDTVPKITKVIEDLLPLFKPTKLNRIRLILNIEPNLAKRHPLYENHSMLQNIVDHESKSILIDRECELNNLDERFFKHKSMKEALKERYGVSSPRLVNIVMKLGFFAKSKKNVTLDTSILHQADVLKEIFLKQNKNESDFLDILEKQSNVLKDFEDAYARGPMWVDGNQEPSQGEELNLLKNFSPSQIKNLFMTDYEGNSYTISDTFAAYKDDSNYFDNLIKEVNFKPKNMNHLHDWISDESKKRNQANFPLNQENYNPNILKINGIKLGEDYRIKIAETSHELISWGNKLGHCVGNGAYAKVASRGETHLLCITKNDEPAFCVEFTKKKIKQIQGKSRCSPDKDLLNSFIIQMKAHELIDSNHDWKPRR